MNQTPTLLQGDLGSPRGHHSGTWESGGCPQESRGCLIQTTYNNVYGASPSFSCCIFPVLSWYFLFTFPILFLYFSCTCLVLSRCFACIFLIICCQFPGTSQVLCPYFAVFQYISVTLPAPSWYFLTSFFKFLFLSQHFPSKSMIRSYCFFRYFPSTFLEFSLYFLSSFLVKCCSFPGTFPVFSWQFPCAFPVLYQYVVNWYIPVFPVFPVFVKSFPCTLCLVPNLCIILHSISDHHKKISQCF